MRLLHARSGQMRDFVSEADTPAYAILSHTWTDEEVSCKEWEGLSGPGVNVEAHHHEHHAHLKSRRGYAKIAACQAQAVRDNIEWVWIDTCCIDKTSSAELTEAINSMFRWYRDATICYGHLADIPDSAAGESWEAFLEPSLRRSRWFTRGWTLQELIAPAEVVFYSEGWVRLGTKTEFASTISSITGIGERFLRRPQSGRGHRYSIESDLETATVAQRMSWAANRQTSRTEDLAYCLLGLFDVNMPLIYGEGSRAFRRLQEEIAKTIPEDHTLYAWGKVVRKFSYTVDNPGDFSADDDVKDNDEDHEHSDQNPSASISNVPTYSLLASSPKQFEHSGNFVNFREFSVKSMACVPTFIGKSMRLDLPLFLGHIYVADRVWGARLPARARQFMHVRKAVLYCGRPSRPFSLLTIPLLPTGHNSWGRTDEILDDDVFLYPNISASVLLRWTVGCFFGPKHMWNLEKGDIIFRRHISGFPFYTLVVAGLENGLDQGVVKPWGVTGERIMSMVYVPGRRKALALVVSRKGAGKSDSQIPTGEGYNGDKLGPLHFGLVQGDAVVPREINTPGSATATKYLFATEFIGDKVANFPRDTEMTGVSEDGVRIQVQCERMYLDDDPGFPVDIVDVVVDLVDTKPPQFAATRAASPMINTTSQTKAASEFAAAETQERRKDTKREVVEAGWETVATGESLTDKGPTALPGADAAGEPPAGDGGELRLPSESRLPLRPLP